MHSNQINWQKTNLDDWENRCILENGNMHKSNAFIDLSYYRIKELIGLPLTPSEKNKLQNLKRKYKHGYKSNSGVWERHCTKRNIQ